MIIIECTLKPRNNCQDNEAVISCEPDAESSTTEDSFSIAPVVYTINSIVIILISQWKTWTLDCIYSKKLNIHWCPTMYIRQKAVGKIDV
jgi:hypothetical protein